MFAQKRLKSKLQMTIGGEKTMSMARPIPGASSRAGSGHSGSPITIPNAMSNNFRQVSKCIFSSMIKMTMCLENWYNKCYIERRNETKKTGFSSDPPPTFRRFCAKNCLSNFSSYMPQNVQVVSSSAPTSSIDIEKMIGAVSNGGGNSGGDNDPEDYYRDRRKKDIHNMSEFSRLSNFFKMNFRFIFFSWTPTKI